MDMTTLFLVKALMGLMTMGLAVLVVRLLEHGLAFCRKTGNLIKTQHFYH